MSESRDTLPRSGALDCLPRCPGGCGGPIDEDGDLCRGCLKGANIVNRNAVAALKRELRAVKILDAWAEKSKRDVPKIHHSSRVWWMVTGQRDFEDATPAECRIAAADALANEDPSLLEGIDDR